MRRVETCRDVMYISCKTNYCQKKEKKKKTRITVTHPLAPSHIKKYAPRDADDRRLRSIDCIEQSKATKYKALAALPFVCDVYAARSVPKATNSSRGSCARPCGVVA